LGKLPGDDARLPSISTLARSGQKQGRLINVASDFTYAVTEQKTTEPNWRD